jgi:hypothetical protein
VMPTATPPDQVEAVLAEAVAWPTLGARQLAGYLADRGVRLSPSGVQKVLRRHRLGRAPSGWPRWPSSPPPPPAS